MPNGPLLPSFSSQIAISVEKEVIIFLLMDGASMARRDVAAGVKHPAFNRLDHMMGVVVRAGAIIYACELCAKFRGISAATLVEGVKLTGAATYLQLLNDSSSAIIIF
ncbi:DsrE family protein [Methanosphaerula subterraneus]|uniref:DsrE family protein n=1 Tax=Methanosphaerula subterraneus TaxID=3350244 RepID=UPI003F8543DE